MAYISLKYFGREKSFLIFTFLLIFDFLIKLLTTLLLIFVRKTQLDYFIFLDRSSGKLKHFYESIVSFTVFSCYILALVVLLVMFVYLLASDLMLLQ